MKRTDIPLPRRGFLAAAAAAPVLAAAALAVKRPALAAPQPPAPEAPAGAAADDAPPARGYHETEHIRQYYALAAF